MQIDGFEIGSGEVYVIAEMGASHCGNYDTAKEIVKSAKWAGANAIKIQTFKPEDMALNHQRFKIKDGLWRGFTLYQLYREIAMPWEWQPKLKKYADEIGITLFSTPFSIEAVDFLEAMNVSAYKVASFEINHIPLLERIAKTEKPVFFSTGTTVDYPEIVQTARVLGRKKCIPLHCVSQYPAKPEDANLRTIAAFSQSWSCHCGLSDHSAGIAIPVAAVALEARVIEKHIKLPGTISADSAFSITPEKFKLMVSMIRDAVKAVPGVKFRHESDLRRSIWAATDIKQGEVFTEDNIKIVRPSGGLEPKEYEKILGQTAKVNIKFATPMNYGLVNRSI